MEQPKPFEEFASTLLDKRGVAKWIAGHYGAEAQRRMQQFRDGNVDEFRNLFEDIKYELSENNVSTIDAAAPDEDVFQIEIRSVESVIYWIQTNEDDEIGYFRSFADAESYAYMNFEPFISALAEREQEE